MLTRKAVGFICASRAAETIPSVSSLSGQLTLRKSLVVNSVSMSTSFTPSSAAVAGST